MAVREVAAADILATLLSGERTSVRSLHVTGVLDFSGHVVPGSLSFDDCVIDGLIARNGRFKGNLAVKNSTVGSVDFTGTVVEGLLDIDDLTVSGELSLYNCRVSSGLPAQNVRVGASLNAAELAVGASVSLNGAQIGGELILREAEIGRMLEVDGHARIAGKVSCENLRALGVDFSGCIFDDDANFDGMSVTSDATFARARFRGAASFISVKVEDELLLDDGEFRAAADFSKIRVRDVLARGVTFRGKAAFDDIAVGLVAHFGTSRFEEELVFDGGTTGDLNLTEVVAQKDVSVQNLVASARVMVPGAKVAGDLAFENVTVAGNVDGRAVELGGSLVLQSTTVGGSMDFGPSDDGKRAVFGTGIAFSSVSVKQDLRLDEVDAGDNEIDLTGTSVDADFRAGGIAAKVVDLSGASVKARVLVERANVRRLKLANVSVGQDCTFSGDVAEEVNLYGTTVDGTLRFASLSTPLVSAAYIVARRDLVVEACRIAHLDVSGASVAGVLELSRSTPPETLNLRTGTFNVIYLTASMVASPDDRRAWGQSKIDLADSTFAYLRCDPSLLMERFTNPRNRQPYLMLEQSLRRRGFDDQADTAYVMGRRGSRARLSGVRAMFDALVDITTGYGVRPLRAVFTFAAVVVLGAAFFATVPGAARSTPSAPAGAAMGPPGTAVGTTGTMRPCLPETPGVIDATYLSLSTVLPTGLPRSAWSVATDCPAMLGGATVPGAASAVVMMLRTFGLIMSPIIVAMLAGLFRPAVRQ